MKNITLSAREDLIERAREVARQRRSTLNQMFRDWLAELAQQQELEQRLRELDLRTAYARPGRKFSREEMHER